MALEYLGSIDSPKSVVTKEYLDNAIGGLDETYIGKTLMGANNGVATLGSDGRVPSAQLPSYVDDVLEYSSKSSFPTNGETGKIYVAIDTNLTYRWSGTGYTEISPSLALGETSSTAYAGDKGKANATAISTLQGYFTNGIAKEAAKVSQTLTFTGFQSKTFNGSSAVTVDIPDALADLTADATHRLVTDIQVGNWNTAYDFAALFEIDANGDVHLKNKGFYADSFVSAGGVSGTQPSGGGLDWSELTSAGTQVIHASHIPSLDISKISNLASASVAFASDAAMLGGVAASSYATQSWVEGKGYRAGTAPASGSWWRGTPMVNTDGVMEVGKYIDCHHANTSTADYSIRMTCPNVTGVDIALPSSSGTLALESQIPTTLPASDVSAWAKKSSLAASDVPSLDWSKITTGKPTTISGYGITDAITTSNIGSQSVSYATGAGTAGSCTGNAATATTLQTSRTIWGQSFDGSGDVSGVINGATCVARDATFNDSWSDGTNTHPWYGYDMRSSNTGVNSTTISDYFGMRFHTGSGDMVITNGGSVGFGTTTPSYPVDIASSNSVCLNMTSSGTQTSMQLSRSATNLWQISHRGTGESNALKFYHFNGSSWNNALSISADGNVTSLGEITAYSDRRLKSNIQDLSFRGRLAPKSYIKGGKQSIGFIAQEVREKYPELVLGEEGKDSYLSLNYGAISAVLSAQLNGVEDEVTTLKKKVASLEAEVAELRRAR